MSVYVSYVPISNKSVWQATFESMEADLKEMNNGVETLERNLVELQELRYVLQYTDTFFVHVSSLSGGFTRIKLAVVWCKFVADF